MWTLVLIPDTRNSITLTHSYGGERGLCHRKRAPWQVGRSGGESLRLSSISVAEAARGKAAGCLEEVVP